MTPVVSILVPMRNAAQFIHTTLVSILEEDNVPLEVVVVDDQSSDNSSEIVQLLNDGRINLVKGSCQGISTAMNVALSAAQGEIIMRCDADDLFTSGRIFQQVAWLRDNHSFGAVCGAFSTMDSRGRQVALLSTGDGAVEITEELRRGVTRTSLCTFAIRRSVVEKIDGYRSYFVTAEDIDYQLRLSGVCRVMYLPEFFYKYRLHDDSITHKQGKKKREFFEDTARHFQRQRRDAGFDDLDRNHPPLPPQSDFDLPGKANDQIAGMLLGSAWLEHRKGRKLNAIKIGIGALVRKPYDFDQWKSFLALILK